MKYLLLISALILDGCSSSTSSTKPTDSASTVEKYGVKYLFTHDGCKVYRFHAAYGGAHYADCRGVLTDSGKK